MFAANNTHPAEIKAIYAAERWPFKLIFDPSEISL
jgi:hypothetical protein